MAVFRNVYLSFWTDNKVEDDFTPEDKYFYVYLLTNPQTNICGCYEVRYSQMTRQTGYNSDTINRLLDRFEKVHDVIRFNKETKEILILNWHKYNWSKSEKTLVGVENVAKHIKCKEFRNYIYSVVKSIRSGSSEIGYQCPMVASVSDTDTVINTNTKDNSNNSTNDYFDLDTAAKQLFNTYPNKNNFASMRAAWLDRFIGVPEKNYKPVANMIWKAVKLFLEDYKEKNEGEPKPYKYLKSMDKFFVEDLDYWLTEVNRRDSA
jgi:hypothetical protein